jgi:hypothetical protein
VKNKTRRTYQIIEEALIRRAPLERESLYAQKSGDGKIHSNSMSWEGIMNLTDLENTHPVMIGS